MPSWSCPVVPTHPTAPAGGVSQAGDIPSLRTSLDWHAMKWALIGDSFTLGHWRSCHRPQWEVQSGYLGPGGLCHVPEAKQTWLS